MAFKYCSGKKIVQGFDPINRDDYSTNSQEVVSVYEKSSSKNNLKYLYF